MSTSSSDKPADLASLIDATTIISLLSTVAILAVAYAASVRLLPKTSTTKVRILFIWHAFDALIHFCLEAGFLYNCFFSYISIPTDGSKASAYLAPNVHFLGQSDRLYGSDYGSNPLSALWREYAKADARWGGTDLAVISLELFTVFLAAPMAVWICYCLSVRREHEAWFWMIVVATAELYGGFITFAPEWLSGSPNLDTSNWMYLWVYLFFFNTLWVWIPFWILYEGFQFMTAGEKAQGGRSSSKKTR